MERLLGKILAVLVAAASFSVAAEAGEILRLKATGAMRTSQLMASFAEAKDTGLYIVQFKGAISEAQKESVKALGLKLLSYIPDDAFLASGNRDIAARAESLGFINAVVPYAAGMKVEPELTKSGIFALQDSVNVFVQTTDEVTIEGLRDSFRSVRKLSDGVFVGQSTMSKVWELAQRKDVLWIERFLPVSTMDMSGEELLGAGAGDVRAAETQTGFESGTKVMNMDAAWSAGFNGSGQLAAYGDTGLDKGDLNKLIPDFVGQVQSAYAMGLGGKSWGDPAMHGTHVAGSIAGNGRSSNGLIKGAAFGAKLVVEGLWSDILDNLSIPGIPQLFDRAYKDGARIHSDSWGAPNSNGRYDSFAVQADTWLFNNMDFLAIFAAGNDGADLNKDGVIDEGSLSSPGSAKNVLTVGASKNYLLEGGIQKKLIELRAGKDKWGVEPLASSMLSEDARGMACFSSRGPAADGRIKPEIVAPGTNIVSARSTNPKGDPAQSWGIYNDSYLYMGGTSMATPLTSGAVTVIRQYLLNKLAVQTVSAALLKATIANTADDLFPGQFGPRSQGQEQPTRRPNNHEGWGLVNMANLVNNDGLRFYDERTGLSTGQEKSFTVTVKDASKPLKVTLAYTDAPGTASATKTLVNDLDLLVTDASGQTFYPNGRTSKDSTNNMEEVDVLAPKAGDYTIKVKAASVPQGKNGAQPYALVVNSAI